MSAHSNGGRNEETEFYSVFQCLLILGRNKHLFYLTNETDLNNFRLNDGNITHPVLHRLFKVCFTLYLKLINHFTSAE
jgi:hypothetical protein